MYSGLLVSDTPAKDLTSRLSEFLPLFWEGLNPPK
jgi:hypothetical protein